MPAQRPLMLSSAYTASHRQLDTRFPEAAVVAAGSTFTEEDESWEGPTLRELVEKVEHQFGQTPALATLFTMGFARDEELTPGDIQAVCDHLGLPAEDFGLDP